VGADIDPYVVLGVPKDATRDEIHDAYRELARRLHPDVGLGDPAEMVRINEAWATLRDVSVGAGFVAAPGAEPSLAERHEGYRDHDERGARVERARLRVMIIATVTVLAIVFVTIFLIGFGRVGVSGHP
jgi:hypothetical protein